MTSSTKSQLIPLFALLSLSAPLSAQTLCTSGSGVLQGAVRDESTGAGIGRSWVALLYPSCRVVTDAAGRFRFERLPAGKVGIDAGRDGYREFARMETTVAAGQTTEIVIRLRRGGPIEDCRANADCAPLLREPMLPAGDEKEQLRFAAYATGIALAFKGLGQEIPRNLCIEETSALVIDELKKRYANIAPAALCVVLPGLNSEVPKGRPTLRVSADYIAQTSATRARAELMYRNSRRGGAGWTCEFERVPGAWRPVLCRHVWDY